MKALIFALLMAFSVPLETYIVISVKGQVTVAGKPLARGSKITDDTKLSFKSRDAQVIVMSPGKGRMVLSAKKATQSGSEFIALVKGSMGKSKFQATSTRAVSTDPTPKVAGDGKFNAIAIYLMNGGIPGEKDNPVKNFPILGKGKFLINKDAFPLNKHAYFAYSFSHNGQEYFNNVSQNGNEVFLKEELLKVNGDSIADLSEIKNGKLFYVTQDAKFAKDRTEKLSSFKGKGHTVFVSEFLPQFLNETVREEIAVVIESAEADNEKEMFEKHIAPFVFSTYKREFKKAQYESREQILVSLLPEKFAKKLGGEYLKDFSEGKIKLDKKD